MRLYGILTDDGDCLYLYDTLASLLESTFDEETNIPEGHVIVRIEGYTALAQGINDAKVRP